VLSDLLWAIVKSVFSLFAVACLLRAYLQWLRVHPLNPLSQSLFPLTNWIVLPLRRVFRGKTFDWASLIAAWITACVAVLLLLLLASELILRVGEEPMLVLSCVALLASIWLAGWALQLVLLLVIAQALMSWFGASPNAATLRVLLDSMAEPFVRPIRQLLYRGAPRGIDFSPLLVLIGIQILLAIQDRLEHRLVMKLLTPL